MITSVLESLTRRVDIFDESGNLCHPLFVTRPEKRILLIIVSGDKGFAAHSTPTSSRPPSSSSPATLTSRSTLKP